MRNLKRALSLTLASVMLLGMMVVGSSAAAGYDDVSKTDNVEAIEVLQTIEVMVGDERGFGPERPVNRAEMAVVMGKLLNLDYNYYATSCPFDDVYDWARGWVGACYANKIVSGRGEGVYDPGATVTAVEAASMLMRALGYFQYANDVADGFELATVRQGTTIGIFDGVGSSATEPMTRNQVAQMVLNALQSGVVEPDGNTINLTTPDGSVYTGRVNYVYVTSRRDFAYAISNVAATSVGSTNDGAIVELGERLYDGDLKLHDFQVDDFGRPSRQWEYKGTDVGTYVKKELLRQTYTTEVTGRDLYDLLTASTIRDYDFSLTVDGETEQTVLTQGDNSWFTDGNLVRTNTKSVGATDKGVCTEVYVDTSVGRETIYVAIINTYLAKATDDYSERREEARFDVYGVDDVQDGAGITLVKKTGDSDGNANNGKQPWVENLIVKNEDINVEAVKKDDFYLVHVAEGEIKEMIDPETIDSTSINSFNTGSWVNADGTKYDYDDTALYDPEVLDQFDQSNMKNTTYRVFLDEYGYLIGLEIVEEPDQYVFLTGIDGSTSNLTNKTADGNIIHLDGTMETVKINMTDSRMDEDTLKNGSWVRWGTANLGALMNTWCRYTVDSNGVYTLTEVAKTTDNFTANKNKSGQGRNTIANVNDPAADILTLDKSHLTLNGIQDVNTSTVKRVYADDDTIFLLAETDVITSLNPGGLTAIIDDVDSVVTGIQNVNMKAWNPNKVKASDTTKYGTVDTDHFAYGAYTLFDDDGVVIAVVVVGEDEGNTSSFAFVHSSNMNQEDYNSDTDNWTWHRDVIVNGELATLTEKRSSNPEIGTMRQGEWYEVKYNAAGEVRSVRALSNSPDAGAGSLPRYDFDSYTSPWTTGNDKYVMDINDVELALENKNTVLLWQDLTAQPYRLRVSRNTLYVDTTTGTAITRGITMTEDAKTALIQDTRRSDRTTINRLDEKFYYSNGGRGVDTALHELNDNANFYGYIGAVFENGRATSIVIWDMTETIINVGTSTPGTSAGIINVNTDNIGTVIVEYTGATQPGIQSALDSILAKLQAQGLTITGISQDASGVYSIQTTGGRYPITYQWNSGTGYNRMTYININGVRTAVDHGASVPSADIQAAGGITGATNIGANYKLTMVDGTVTWPTAGTAVKTDGTTDADTVASIEYGFYPVTVGTTVTGAPANQGSAVLNVTIDGTNNAAGTAYVKVNNPSIALTVTVATANTAGRLTLAATTGGSNVGTVSNGATMPQLNVGGTHKVTVTLTQAQLTTGTPDVDLTATNVVETLRITVKRGSQTATINVADTENSWLRIAQSAGFDVAALSGSLYVRDNADWTTGEAENGAISTVALVDGHTYTFGCNSVGIGTAGTEL